MNLLTIHIEELKAVSYKEVYTNEDDLSAKEKTKKKRTWFQKKNEFFIRKKRS